MWGRIWGSECMCEHGFFILCLTINDEFDFFVRVSRGVSGSVDRAEVDPVVPPHHLSDHQVGLCKQTHTHTLPITVQSR